jgi:predicted small secreted protein
MKTNGTYRIGWAALALALLLAACNNLAGPGRDTLSGETIPEGMGMARIQLNIGEGAAQSVRTALPGGVGAYYFTLKFTAPGKTTVEKQLSGSGGATVTSVALEPVVWTLEVNGYTNSARNTLAVTGRTTVPIITGTVSPFTVYLTPDFTSGETGSLLLNINFPSSARVLFGLYPIDNTPEQSIEENISSILGSVSWSYPYLQRGSYRAVISLYDSAANEAAAWTGVVHIYKDLLTTLAHTFTAADFAPCPPTPTVVPAENTLAAKLDAAMDSPAGAYTIALDGTETDLGSFAPKTFFTGIKDISITIRGNGKTVQLGSTGSLFTLDPIYSSVSLELHDVTLKGRSDNTAPLIKVDRGGTLVMKTGSSITDNTNTVETSYGGGVYVGSTGTFTMNGGAVLRNSTSASPSYGGGVHIRAGTFTMNGGEVAFNSAFSNGGGVFFAYNGTFTMTGGVVRGNTAGLIGGGVCGGEGIFTMSGGAVLSNHASSSVTDTTWASGGGVYIDYGTFNLSAGVVHDNYVSAVAANGHHLYTTEASGGGVYVGGGGTLNMSGGVVSGNYASSSAPHNNAASGGGVFLSSGTFTMSDGVVSGNAARSYTTSVYGGGVCVGTGTFTMDGGVIRGNEARAFSSPHASYGGGVYVNAGTFTMNGGEVRGNVARDYPGATTATSRYSSGGGVWVAYNGTFTKQPGAVIYGSNEIDTALPNFSRYNGAAVYISSSAIGGAKIRNNTADRYLTLDSSQSGSANGWEEISSGISSITYSAAAGSPWTLQPDGRYKSAGRSKTQINFTTTEANVNITIQLDVSSEKGYDFAYIGSPGNSSAAYNNSAHQISGITSATMVIPVPTVGNHFIQIGYYKDELYSAGSDCAWFKIIE